MIFQNSWQEDQFSENLLLYFQYLYMLGSFLCWTFSPFPPTHLPASCDKELSYFNYPKLKACLNCKASMNVKDVFVIRIYIKYSNALCTMYISLLLHDLLQNLLSWRMQLLFPFIKNDFLPQNWLWLRVLNYKVNVKLWSEIIKNSYTGILRI